MLLYNIHSLAQDTLGFPKLKQGLIALLTGGKPATGGVSVGRWGVLLAVITVVSVGLEVRGLWRLPRWRQQAGRRAWWRHLVEMLWAFVPAALVLAMPAIVLSTAGRAFGYLTLFRSMLGVMIWLGLCGVLSVLNGLLRLAWLLRRR